MSLRATVYTQPSCVQCDRTKKLLDERGVEVTTHDLATDPERLAIAKELGYQAAPITFVIDEDGKVVDHFSGFAITKLNAHFPKPTKES